jgi:hypothetical protein
MWVAQSGAVSLQRAPYAGVEIGRPRRAMPAEPGARRSIETGAPPAGTIELFPSVFLAAPARARVIA